MPTAKEREEAVAACGGSVRFAELTGRAPAELRLWRSSGCVACGGTGFAGRVVLHELLVVDDAIRGAIQRRASMLEMRSLAAAAGTTSLLEDAWAKVVAGELDSRSLASMKLR